MHTGVGAAAGVQANASAGEFPERFFKRFLHCAIAGLGLPALKVGAIVGEYQDEIAGAGHPRCATSSCAICTALVAAPLRKLSATTHSTRPCGTVGSLRMRPMKTSSLPSISSGIGGESHNATPV